MGTYQSDIQLLLREMAEHPENNIDHQPERPYSRPMLANTQRPMADQYQAQDRSQPRVYSPPHLFEDQTSRPLGSLAYNRQDVPLDAYDPELLADPQGHADHGMSRLLQPRSSYPFPSREAYSSRGTIPQREPSHCDRAPQSPKDSRLSLPHNLYTPPPRRAASTFFPSTRIPSSPSLAVSQRRRIQGAHGNEPKSGPQSSSPPFPSPAEHRRTSLTSSHQYKSPNNPNGREREMSQGRPVRPSSSAAPTQALVQVDRIGLGHAPPIAQGIQLVCSHEMPDRFRSVFPFQLFNGVQSKCYETVYKTNENLVLSAPTGSGKTAVLELAICQLVSSLESGQYKIVYMAPTKSLCSERQRDWQAKFATLDLRCAELTGDTDQVQLRNVQNASIIITTPEKWDSMTRKWKDHAKLMQLIKLFLIDEVHILKDTRGATLEAVVSRMKSVGSHVRFLALSATVPNSEDIATWLGRDPIRQHLPAQHYKFGEEFRPVKLQKFVYGIPYSGNDFGFEKVCDPKLPEIIAKHSRNKPIMVFCITRKSTIATAKTLANLWATKGPRERLWPGPTRRVVVQDQDLRETLGSAVAFHHAGLDSSDRDTVEKGFLEGRINVICCTSTLAVGVNLPCHLVIVKGTATFKEGGLKEYADLEIMQMLGRAGRPQFEDSAIAVIITKQDKFKKYEMMVSGQELLESCLHLNLIDHLNAEIGLGTVYDMRSAKRWLAGTFLCVRLGKNPDFYKLDGDTPDHNLDRRIEVICKRDVGLLEETRLVTCDEKLNCTEFGDAMSRYYVKFETMQGLLSLSPRSKMSDILSALAGAKEFYDVRLRGGEKKLFKEINNANGIKYPIKVDIALPAHKRSLIIQAELGGVDFPADEQYVKHRKQYQQDRAVIFSQINRLIRCVIDCQIFLEDAVTTRHALELARSFGAHVWDNSPYQMKQIAQIGPVAIRKLAIGGINSIEALEAAEPHRIEMLTSKNPPFGNKILASLKDFPKLRVSLNMMSKDVKQGQPVKVRIKAECGFINDRVPTMFHRKPIYVCLLVERSDGHLVDFRRISAMKLNSGQDILLTAELLKHDQYITCYIMCDEIVGTMRYVELKPGLPASLFPPTLALQVPDHSAMFISRNDGPMHHSKGKSGDNINNVADDEFSDDGLNDQDLLNAVEGNDFSHIDTFDDKRIHKSKLSVSQSRGIVDHNHGSWNPKQLENGKWACNHKCKDKTACKHLCCHEGVDKPPKPPKNLAQASPPPSYTNSSNHKCSSNSRSVQSQLQIGRSNEAGLNSRIERVDLAQGRDRDDYTKFGPRDYRKLHQLHEKVTKASPVPTIGHTKPSYSYSKGEQPRISFLSEAADSISPLGKMSSDYDDNWMDDLPSPSALLGQTTHVKTNVFKNSVNAANLVFDEDISDIEANMIGFNDSLPVKENPTPERTDAALSDCEEHFGPYDLNQANDHVAWNVPILSPPAEPQHELHKREKAESTATSTDSPGNLTLGRIKRKATASSDTEVLMMQSAPLPKKQKTIDREPDAQTSPINENQAFITDSPLPSSAALDLQAQPPSPKIKPGYPAWVYDLDPAFIAEYEDYVEFV